MAEGKVIGINSRLKRTTNDEDTTTKDEPPFKSQRLYSPSNDDPCYQGPLVDNQSEKCEITEQNYKKIPATTLYKKLQVLEAHDRVVRATTVQPLKEINVDEIKPMIGTCYDMCPEKERLLRIHGNMVSQFECKIVDSKLEPIFEIMVKQYARSSADQANPLSHELRPTPVLIKTMNYMLKNIIFPIESNFDQDLASWYDFCWDRLRAIRKDIVQQNLQNSEVITILEQIGRFHIACYDLMIGYAGFDIKLNTENLNNCIQMLMPMYRDTDHQCPNEAEFVSYELLMHLGNPQFHTAYDLLPNHIKQSSQVRFCIKAHTTYLQSSDCLEFFKLLKSTTYMNCCILQRVIPSIRFNNLQMMNMSYTTSKRIYKLEMKHFMEILCFDDFRSAQEFCSDIQLKFDGIHVGLSRKTTICAPEQRRQRQEYIIVQKRQHLTFLISGLHTLPNVIISSVHSSFDDRSYFIDSVNNKLNGDPYNEESEFSIVTDIYSPSNLKGKFLFSRQRNFSNVPIQSSSFEVPTFTFKLPTSSTQVKTQSFSSELLPEPSNKLSISHNSIPLSVGLNLTLTNKLSNSPKSFTKLPISPILKNLKNLPNKKHFTENQPPTQFTKMQIKLAKIYFNKWLNYVNNRKSKCIEEMFSLGELFHPECISSLSSSPTSEKSFSFNYFNDCEEKDESKEWLRRQFRLAEKYFYIWLRNVLRKRRKIIIDSASSLPWSFIRVQGSSTESLRNVGSKLKSKKGKRIMNFSIGHPSNHHQTNNDDFSDKIANIFVKNVLNGNKKNKVGKKIFWKLAVNYGELCLIENKVMAIIYGKTSYGNNHVQTIHTDYNACFIKAVQSCSGLYDWTRSGLNAALVFTNNNKEHIDVLFKRVDSILQSTPTAIPMVLIFSSSSNTDEMENYQLVLDTYREKEYINNYLVTTWQGPITILEAIEFLSNNYVDITPNMRSETLFYNLLNFAQFFFLKVRYMLPEDNPNIIIERYNKYLSAYVERLGRKNYELRDIASELVPHYTLNPEKFSSDNSNLNVKYFEDILNNARLLPYPSWPPESVDDLINYVKDMCQLTNRRCWCLDMLQMLQLHRNADLDQCLLNASWYEIIEMWIEGTLEKCSNNRENFIVLYSDNPIADALKIAFPDS